MLTDTEARALASLCERGHALTGPAGTEPWTPMETLTAAGLARIAGRSAALILIEPTAAGRRLNEERKVACQS